MADRDKRYQRTHQKIRGVFEELIQTVPFQEITVSRISQQAGINRKTFYMHFDSTTALLNELVDDLSKEFKELDQIYQENDGLYGAGLIVAFFEILERRESLHRRLICAPEYLFVFQQIAEQILRQHTARFRSGLLLDPFRQRALSTFLIGGVMPIYRGWLLSGKPIPQKELAQFLELLIQSCLDGLNLSASFLPQESDLQRTAPQDDTGTTPKGTGKGIDELTQIPTQNGKGADGNSGDSSAGKHLPP